MTELELLRQNIVMWLALSVMIVGLIFTVIPPLPGIIIIWAAAIGYGLLLGWEQLGWLTFSFLTLLMILGLIADLAAGQVGAKMGGASCWAIGVGTMAGFGAGIIASLVGTPVVGCLAGVAGTLGGILLVERARYGDWRKAIGATQGYLAGTTAGIIAKLLAGGLMIGVFLLRVFWLH
jgi:uncharacterized protein YqgC (DUF456 family)